MRRITDETGRWALAVLLAVSTGAGSGRRR